MYNQHDWASDQVQDLIQESLEKNPAATTSFSFDDAFSDDDDSNPNYAFSSIVIRADLARAVSHSQEGNELGDAEELSGVDAAGDAGEPGLSLLVFGFPVTTRGLTTWQGHFRFQRRRQPSRYQIRLCFSFRESRRETTS